jgi:hypothetical protein
MQNMQKSLDGRPSLDEPVFTPDELAKLKKVHVSTIRRAFVDEPGVLRLGSPGNRRKRQHFTLRIPLSVAERVFGRMTVPS